ncbi:MAG: hypothetical protein MEQ07_09225 [Aquimonas sp.]|nr:hypothetical protein [Aquimonas sp.]
MNRARLLAELAAGTADPAAAAWLAEGLRCWLRHAEPGGQGPSLEACLGVRSAADARRLIRDHWLREAAATLPEAGSWTRARTLHMHLGAARRLAARRALDPAATAAPLVDLLARAVESRCPLPTTVQALHNVLGGNARRAEQSAA